MRLVIAGCLAVAACGEVETVEVEQPASSCVCAWVPKGSSGACRIRFDGCLDDAGATSECADRPPRPPACWSDAG